MTHPTQRSAVALESPTGASVVSGSSPPTAPPKAAPSHGPPTRAAQSSPSELPGFYRLSQADRRAHVASAVGLSDAERRVLVGDGSLDAEQAEHMVENAVGVLSLPLGLAANFRIDAVDRLVPMATEEASVIAAASHAAKLLRGGEGIRTECTSARMIGQIQLLDVPAPARAAARVSEAEAELLALADRCDPCLCSAGGGARAIRVRELPAGPGDPVGDMTVVHLVVDVRDAMGANTVNGMCERLAPRLEQLTGGKALLRIISNLADERLVSASGAVPLAALGHGSRPDGHDLACGIQAASVLAERDPYRAATHNKGIMNGVDAVLVAFAQDWRAVEAGAHAYAARSGRYGALSRWRVVGDALVGRIELPLPVGVVGGVSAAHPGAAVARRIARVTTAAELASVAAAVGLAQNLGALRALAGEGIQRGHMQAHARNAAFAAGALASEVGPVATQLASSGTLGPDAARAAVVRARTVPPPGERPAPWREHFTRLRDRHAPAMLALLERLTGRALGEGSSLAQMSRYHLATGGKRLRAVLPLAVAEALGEAPERLIPFGAACELLHNATLVHDDIQDGDRVRRGRPTVWAKFGMARALNLGDAMFYLTLLAVGRLETSAHVRERAAERLVRETLRVIDGQEREIALLGAEHPSVDDYVTMVEGKTSGLFALPIAGAAEILGASESIVTSLEQAARHLGVLFQIQDDLLDLYGDKGREAAGSDVAEGKRSLLVVHALENASPQSRARLVAILDGERSATGPEQVREAVSIFEEAGSRRFALESIRARERQATEAVASAEHPALGHLVAGCRELLLAPIASLFDDDRHPGATC